MDRLEDDEMMNQWEDVSKEEEKITVRKMEGKRLQVEGVQKVLEFLVSQVVTKEKEPKKEKKKTWLVRWSTEKMREFRDTEEMVQWRNIDQEGINNMWETCWKTLKKKCWRSTKWR